MTNQGYGSKLPVLPTLWASFCQVSLRKQENYVLPISKTGEEVEQYNYRVTVVYYDL